MRCLIVFCPNPKKSGPDTEFECCRFRIVFARLTMLDHAPVAVPEMTACSGTSEGTIWNFGPSPPSRIVQLYTTSILGSMVERYRLAAKSEHRLEKKGEGE